LSGIQVANPHEVWTSHICALHSEVLSLDALTYHSSHMNSYTKHEY